MSELIMDNRETVPRRISRKKKLKRKSKRRASNVNEWHTIMTKPTPYQGMNVTITNQLSEGKIVAHPELTNTNAASSNSKANLDSTGYITEDHPQYKKFIKHTLPNFGINNTINEEEFRYKNKSKAKRSNLTPMITEVRE